MFVFLVEEYGYMSWVILLSKETTVDEIREWWNTEKGSYSKPLPGEEGRGRIIWKSELNPPSGWQPVSWSKAGDIVHEAWEDKEAERRTMNYAPEELTMPEDAVFVHTHMHEDSFLRLPGEEEIPHPDYTPTEEE
jgi:hypothetical protein